MPSDLQSDITNISRWLTESYGPIDPEAAMWRRVGKIGEEHGEAIEALLGVIGENPRKGVHKTMADLLHELMDVALCALGAMEHLTGFDGSCMVALAEHARTRVERTGLVSTSADRLATQAREHHRRAAGPVTEEKP